ncbi:PKD domain-containing protein [Mucilaginibacter sp.]
MKQLSIKIILCFFSFFLFAIPANAQQFKWAKGGGSNANFSSAPSTESEQTKYICTDPDGNVYALSQVGDNSIFADTFVRLEGAYGADQNILLTSYNCSGQMRWAKLIASNAGPSFSSGIVADSLGNIYVSGFFTNATLHIGYDTAITGLADENSGLIQFDTAGHFKWVRYIGDNIPSNYYQAGTGPLTLDKNNNAHLFAYINDGVHITPTETSLRGTYDLVYNTSGTLLSSVRLDLDSEWLLNSVIIDPITNKLYTSGQINQSIFGGFLTDTFFAAAFDPSRHLLWQHFCGHGDDDAIVGVTLDQSKHLHFCGNAQTTSLSDTTRFSFNGDSVANTHYPYYNMSIVMTTDTNGHPEWIKHFDGDLDINGLISIAQLPNNKVVAAGTFVGNITDGTTGLTTSPGYGYSPYFVVLDSGGNLLNIQQAYGDGFDNSGNVVTSDKIGNIFIGGYVADSVFGGTAPAYYSIGGNSDFFVMKYGVDCSCTTATIASYADTGTHHTIGVTYTGTATALDSVVWNFGDGYTATGLTNTHTYAAAGTYHVCVTAYTECGMDERCSTFTVDSNTHVLVKNVNGTDVRVYPNPAKDELNVTGLQKNTAYQLFSITGVSVEKGALQQGNSIISMQGVSPGVYLLELVGLDGERNMVRVVKQ